MIPTFDETEPHIVQVIPIVIENPSQTVSVAVHMVILLKPRDTTIQHSKFIKLVISKSSLVQSSVSNRRILLENNLPFCLFLVIIFYDVFVCSLDNIQPKHGYRKSASKSRKRCPSKVNTDKNSFSNKHNIFI